VSAAAAKITSATSGYRAHNDAKQQQQQQQQQEQQQ
jgi:hypothetical protein